MCKGYLDDMYAYRSTVHLSDSVMPYSTVYFSERDRQLCKQASRGKDEHSGKIPRSL